ncbi:sugar ABC transporter permease [Novacetimonas sp. GS1]|uniref:carbohydrate ABC transporter permease n=1 Tax=Novacetimonas sp. GS1 TaxID=3119990 RepID=UPI002FCD0C65
MHRPAPFAPRPLDWRPWLLVAPALLVLAAIIVVPLGRTVWLALHADPHGFARARTGWGMGNFVMLAHDAAWWQAMRTTLTFAIAAVSVETVLGLLVALVLLDASARMRGIVLPLVLLPWAIPAVVAARLWNWMLNDQYGIINALLVHCGIITHGIAWTGFPGGMVAVMVGIDAWQATPFMALLCLAGLLSLPPEIMEAARVDGASAWQRLRYITLPLLRPVIGIAALFRLLDALRMFDLASVLYGSDMAGMSLSVFVQAQIVQFGAPCYGAAAALATLGVIGLTVGLLWVCLRAPVRRGDVA